MDRELEDQIDELIHKATKDLKTRIVRIVVRHQNKLLKQQARDLKTGNTTTNRRAASTGTTAARDKRRAAPPKKATSSKKDDRYYSDSDSDGYYSG